MTSAPSGPIRWEPAPPSHLTGGLRRPPRPLQFTKVPTNLSDRILSYTIEDSARFGPHTGWWNHLRIQESSIEDKVLIGEDV